MGHHKKTNIHIIGVPEEEERGRERSLCKDITPENFPNLRRKKQTPRYR